MDESAKRTGRNRPKIKPIPTNGGDRWGNSTSVTLIPIVKNLRSYDMTPGGILIDRRSIWGNPYRAGYDGDRDEVCDMYEAYVLKRPALLDNLHLLVGKTLWCWCDPLRCHGHTLSRLVATRVLGLSVKQYHEILAREDKRATRGRRTNTHYRQRRELPLQPRQEDGE